MCLGEQREGRETGANSFWELQIFMLAGCPVPVRYTQIFLLFTAMVLTFHQRINVPEVIVVLTADNGTHAQYMPQVCGRIF